MSAAKIHNAAFGLLAALAHAPETPALVCNGENLTRRQLASRILARAATLSAIGVVPGARCLITSGRGVEFWIDFFALWTIGAVALPIESATSDEHAVEIVRCAAPRFYAGDPAHAAAAFHTLIPVPETASDAAANADPAAWRERVAPVAGGSLAGVLFTSGTTGLPKGVRVRHEMLTANALGSLGVLGLRPTDRLLFSIPFRFISSISHVLVTLLSGATVICNERRLMPKDLIDLMADSQATAFGGAPLQLRFIAESERARLPQLRWVMSSGDHLPVAVIEALRDRFPKIQVNCVYGLTELAGRFCALHPDLLDRHAGSVGRPIPGLSLGVLDDEGRPSPPGELGHVHAGGLACFDGYEGNDAATRAALTLQGFKTGDMGKLSEDGFLYLGGRSDSVFKRAGLKVSTVPIADGLMATGFFEDVAVMPREDMLQGHVPVAYYVLKPGISFDKPAIQAALREALPINNLPADYRPIPQVPRTGSGKIDRRGLRALIDD